jgi:ATP-dependent Clp protease ATP-binding subunit ClpC
MEEELHQRVIGQDESIKAISRAIRRSRAGLKDPNRPIGSFIFSGPTGVGKTELARALAEFLFADRDALIRVDMSEYMEKFSVSRLIGAPPGYVGYEDSGTLTKAIRRRPYSVVLLDEIEKAAELRDRERELQGEIRRKQEEWEQERKSHRPVIDEEDIGFIVSRWTGIPVSRLKQAETERLVNMEEELHQRVIGQDEAIKAISRAIRRSRAGLKDPNRPIGSFIFSGPTGVGKTELARALAEFLFADRDALIRVDMSEYMEKFSVSRLIGAPPGYVGYEDSGTLTKAIRRRPYSVVLLDEIEKAHPDVFNILLQVLDEGRLTDNYGRVIDFKNTVIIMTSNLGARGITKGGALGFHQQDETTAYDSMRDRVKDEIERAFNPEFLNRVDDIIVFHPLNREQISRIVHIMLKEVYDRLAEENLKLTLTDAALAFLVDRGYDEKFGARPLRRAIQRYIEDPLSERILAREVPAGEEIEVDVTPEGDSFEFRVLSTKT